MNQVWQKNIEEILKTGKPLFEIGINNWALTKIEALNAIEQFYSLEVAILGGDVYAIRNEMFVSTYDNWYCDRLPQEEQSNFLNRSIDKARQYIEAYNAQEPDKTFFVLVPDF
jgi:hypothetical protein